MRAKRKPSRKSALKKLHGALRSLLDKPPSVVKDKKLASGLPEILPASKPVPIKKSSLKSQPSATAKSRDFVVSREHQLIPKLSDNEIMERHKLADENMRRVWTSIINKYESIEDQGDVLDLQTGEVVVDNGHIRGLSQNTETEREIEGTRYQSILKDVIDLKKDRSDQFALWRDDDVDDEDDDDYEVENDADDDGDENEADDETVYAEYKQLLKNKIDV